MMFLYLKALHIIFIVTWFAGMFYIVRLFIYLREAQDKPENEKKVLTAQLSIMSKRLWYGITWPSAILTLILGPLVFINSGWKDQLFQPAGRWLLIKLGFVVLLYLYHFSLHKIFAAQQKEIFNHTSRQLRLWNEVATLFLFAIVMLAVVKTSLSFVWAFVGLIALAIVLMTAIRIYRKLRTKNNSR